MRQQQFIELINPGADLRKRLRLSLVAEIGRLRSNHLPHALPRNSHLTADQFDRLALYKKCAEDLRNRFQNQQPNLGFQRIMEASVDPSAPGSRLDADHPENGVLIPCRNTSSRPAVMLLPKLAKLGTGLTRC